MLKAGWGGQTSDKFVPTIFGVGNKVGNKVLKTAGIGYTNAMLNPDQFYASHDQDDFGFLLPKPGHTYTDSERRSLTKRHREQEGYPQKGSEDSSEFMGRAEAFQKTLRYGGSTRYPINDPAFGHHSAEMIAEKNREAAARDKRRAK